MPDCTKVSVLTQFINSSYDIDLPRTPPFVPSLFNGFAFVILARRARSPTCPNLDLISGNESPVIVKNDRKDLRHCRAAIPKELIHPKISHHVEAKGHSMFVRAKQDISSALNQLITLTLTCNR